MWQPSANILRHFQRQESDRGSCIGCGKGAAVSWKHMHVQHCMGAAMMLPVWGWPPYREQVQHCLTVPAQSSGCGAVSPCR